MAPASEEVGTALAAPRHGSLAEGLREALTLKERLRLAGAAPQTLTPAGDETSVRLRRWLAAPAFENPASLDHFVRCQGTDFSRFRAVIECGPPAGPRGAPPPGWLRRLLAHLEDGETADGEPGAVAQADPFLAVAGVLVEPYRERLAHTVRALNRRFPGAIGESVAHGLLDGLLEQLSVLLVRPLVLELNIARITGRLRGNTPADRLASFHRLLRTRAFRDAFFATYPVLARDCLRACRQWLASSREFLRRYCRDRCLLADTLGQRVSGTLAAAAIAGSDSHHGGRRVVIATLADGSRLVYKPRPMRAAARFQSFLTWLNERGQSPPLRALMVVDRGAYGWCEHVAAAACASPAEARLFYGRQGALLAVLYVLAATDGHFENLVAAGAHPVLIDVETLLQPRLRAGKEMAGSPPPDEEARDSVMDVGMLPRPVRTGGGLADVSALGAGSSSLTPLETIGLAGHGTDELRVERTAFRIGEAHNRPTIAGSPVRLEDYLDVVEAGFSSTYECIRGLRDQVLAPDGPLHAFADAPVRVVFRSTAAYTALLNESVHPAALRDGLERERVLAQLWWATAFQPVLRRIVRAEYGQMLRGDVPYFSMLPGSSHVHSADGAPVGGVIATPGLWVAEDRIRRMGDADLALQLRLIRESILSMAE